jgi:hypothetical protein
MPLCNFSPKRLFKICFQKQFPKHGTVDSRDLLRHLDVLHAVAIPNHDIDFQPQIFNTLVVGDDVFLLENTVLAISIIVSTLQ